MLALMIAIRDRDAPVTMASFDDNIIVRAGREPNRILDFSGDG